jgi:hypothetical protein
MRPKHPISKKPANASRSFVEICDKAIALPLLCPGRGAAFFTPLRRTGTAKGAIAWCDPGSAKQHHSASKTRVNALSVLHRVRDTMRNNVFVTASRISALF